MKPVIISIALFIAMKLVYTQFADYTNEYWALVYYIPLYSMIITLLWYICKDAVRIERMFLQTIILYFSLMLLVHVICLFKIELYGKLVSNYNEYGTPTLLMLLAFGGILVYIKRKKP